MKKPQSLTYHFEGSTIHFLQFGKGEQLLFCFHGFAENAGFILPIQKSLEEKYTVLSMDVAYHGKTRWKQDSLKFPEKLPGLLIQVAESVGFEKFSLLGFSMGGRMIFDQLERIPERINSVYLLAPAGVLLNPFSHWFSNTKMADVLARFLHRNPAAFRFIIDMSYRLGRMDHNFYLYISERFKNPEKRKRINHIRNAMKRYRPDLPEIGRLSDLHGIQVVAIFGERDKVIPKSHLMALKENIPGCRGLLVPKSHMLVDEELNETFFSILG